MNIKDENKKKIEENIKVNKDRGLPKWINLDEAKFSATVLDLPDRDDVGFPIEEQLIVELYSK